jgi:hypothetical protein
MFKKLINNLYLKYCRKPEEAFFVEEKQFTDEELKHIYAECKLMLENGILDKVKDMTVIRSEQRQLYGDSMNLPLTVTQAELERQRRIGIEELFTKIKELANKVPKQEKDFDKNAII